MGNPSFLIVKLGAVGDCVHTLYPLRALREAYPDARIGWVVEDKSAGVVEGHSDLDEVIIFPRKAISLERQNGGLLAAGALLVDFQRDLQRRGYERAIDFQNLFKSGYVAWVSGAKRRIGFRKLREANFLFTNQRIPSEGTHAIEKYMSLLWPFGIWKIPESVTIHVPEKKKEAGDRFFEQHGLANSKVVAVNPGASWDNKRLESKKYAEAIDRLAEDGVRSVLCWGPGEEHLVEEIRPLCGSGPLVAPETDIKELFHLLGRCDLYLGNDSGPMHLAAAAGIGVAAVFGPSDPGRVGPFTQKRAIVRADVDCSPCWKRSCPLPRTLCMEQITADDLVKNARNLLGIS